MKNQKLSSALRAITPRTVRSTFLLVLVVGLASCSERCWTQLEQANQGTFEGQTINCALVGRIVENGQCVPCSTGQGFYIVENQCKNCAEIPAEVQPYRGAPYCMPCGPGQVLTNGRCTCPSSSGCLDTSGRCIRCPPPPPATVTPTPVSGITPTATVTPTPFDCMIGATCTPPRLPGERDPCFTTDSPRSCVGCPFQCR